MKNDIKIKSMYPECSDEMKSYFDEIVEEVNVEFKIASEARKKLLDPNEKVEISLAKNMAERVVGLISTVAPQIIDSNVVGRIHELEEEYGILDWRVAFKMAEELAKQELCKFKNEKEAIEIGIRTGFAYITIGTVSSCLEGFTHMEIVDRRDKKGKYFCLYYSGPTRNAGGTAAACSVLIADYVRKKLGYAQYDPDENEINRTFCEVEHYNERCVRVQYLPSKEELDFLTKNISVQISGEPTERIEVPNYKNLPRVHTNIIRGGFCLVMAECLVQKATKLWKQLSKWGHEFDMEQWDFLDELLKIQKVMKAKTKKGKNEGGEKPKITPDYTFITDLVGGRPVFTHPLRTGGFRLRYGRSRASGLSGQSVHPATMIIANEFIATGTQLKVERPGKASTYTSCNSIEGPIVKLKSGDVLRVETEKKAREIYDDVEEIIFLGDILICYGDFTDRGHSLVPAGYCEEWWVQELEKSIVDTFGSLDFEKASELCKVDISLLEKITKFPTITKINSHETHSLSNNLKVPLHPYFLYHWKDISNIDFDELLEHLKISKIDISKLNNTDLQTKSDMLDNINNEDNINRTDNINRKNKIIIPKNEKIKQILEHVGIPHIFATEYYVVEGDDAHSLYLQLNSWNFEKILESKGENPLERLNTVLNIKLRDKSGTFIGARMGRPEKGKMRKMKGSPHGLFPIGEEGGRMRSMQSALKIGKVNSGFPILKCESCNYTTIYPMCEKCGSKTVQMKRCHKCGIIPEDCEHDFIQSFSEREIDFQHYFQDGLSMLGTTIYPDLIKGIKGTVNKEHYLEHITKAILRAKHEVNVNKDGTVRYDATEVALTHFKPREVSVSVSKLKELGYNKDIYGKELFNDDQILELKCQDVVLPCCKEIEYPADLVLLRTTKFIDELLEKVYGLPKFYNCKNREDLVGHLIISLAPHTSAGTVSRIIGFSRNQTLMAHPFLHCACRRDADGDELGFFLLLDGFLNFSKKFLPQSRGGTMDAPLVLTSVIDPTGVDDMVFNMDTVWKYPRELYESALEYKMPWDVKVELVKDRLGKSSQYEGYGFTHDNIDFNTGVFISAYKTLQTMKDKLLSQMDVASKIRAVDTSDVASLVINKHFLKDTKGNLRKFSQQQFRCVNCNEKYRRPPLSGKCLKCSNGKLIFTISEGSVIKYLQASLDIAEKYGVPDYVKQSLEIVKLRIDSYFGKESDKQEGLGKWFGEV